MGVMDHYTSPDFGAMALVTIDVQRDFLDDGVCAIAGTTAVLPQMAAVLRAFRTGRLPIIHVVRVYKSDGSNVDLCRRTVVESGTAVVQPGTSGVQLATALGTGPVDPDLLLTGTLQPLGDREWAMYKPRWGAFYGTGLDKHLRSLQVTTLAFTGCNFPNCPRTSIYEASERDFRIVLVEDAISGLYDRGKDELKGIGVPGHATTRDRLIGPPCRQGPMNRRI
jgi:nicotinamidase-related amidase